jgi:negative regulator of replication initiation
MLENFNNDFSKANVANFTNKTQDNARQQANQYNYAPEQTQNLAEAAKEIQQLLKQLEKTNPTETELEKVTVAAKAAEEIKNNPTLKTRVISALKSGGTEAFKEAVDNPIVNILVAIIEGWTEAE